MNPTYCVQFAHKDSLDKRMTEYFQTEYEREQAIADAKEDGYVAVRVWEE